MALVQGCVHTRFETPTGFKGNRTAFLYPFKSGINIDPETGILKFDYNTEGGGENLKAAFSAIYEAGLKAGKAGAL